MWAKVDGEAGGDPEGKRPTSNVQRPTLKSESASAIRGFLVEKGTPGFTSTLIEGKLSLRAALTAELQFDDCAIPASALLPKSGGVKSPLCV